MSNPNNYMDGSLVGVVVGGDINDPAPDHSGNMRIFIPGLHGKDVKIEHLAFSGMTKSPTKGSQATFEGTLDPGSMVFVRKDTGSNHCNIIGTANDLINYDKRIPGNADLLAPIAHIFKRDVNIRIPPTVRETMKGGVKVREKVEKGQKHSHSLLAGLPNNGALYSLSGAIVPQVTGVSTATQAFTSILSAAVAGKLPGLNLSLGSLLGSLTTGGLVGALAGAAGNIAGNIADDLISDIAGDLAGQVIGDVIGGAVAGTVAAVELGLIKELNKELLSKLSPDMRKTLRSMSLLTQSIETGVGGGFMSGGKVDPSTYLQKSAGLLGQCKGVGDMVSCMQQIQYDTSLFGQDKLPSITMLIDTPFGIPLPLSISPSGLITQNIPAPLKAVIDLFSGAMANGASFPGVIPGQNLFGSSAGVMLDMFGRLSGPSQAAAIGMARALNQGAAPQKFARVLGQTVAGGNPLTVLLS